jgi:hypothetical protein
MNKLVAFNLEDVLHTGLLSDCARETQRNLLALQTIDRNVMKGFAVGIAAFTLSYIFPIGLLATAGFVYAGYQMGCRSRAFVDYQNALDNLVNCCKWSLGGVKNEATLENSGIKEMINTLAPLINADQLRELIDDNYEEQVVDDATKTNSNLTVMNHLLNREEATLYFKVYGYKQGGSLDMLYGLKYAIANAYNYLKETVTSSESRSTVPSAP